MNQLPPCGDLTRSWPAFAWGNVVSQPRKEPDKSEHEDGREAALLARVRRGDRGAFAELYRRYHARLFAYLRRLLHDPGLVEEALDDVMLVVWKDARKFRGESRVSTWIFGIAYHKALTAIRAARRYHAALDHGADLEMIPDTSGPVDDWIDAALARLSPDHNQVMVLTYMGGFSVKEIAEIADCPVNTVKTRMFHARRRLRVLLPMLAGGSKGSNRERA